jgi:3'-phosphoadenosine 5'-phosphosulfate (PAPS) 3'-phosphatase
MSEVVVEVGKLLLRWRAEGKLGGYWEAPYKFKAEVDGLAHHELFNRLNALNPRLPIISEEDSASHVLGRPSRYWLIDPIDGTASYVQGFDGFVTQVALIEHDTPTMSAVYAPVWDELYTAVRLGGAFKNSAPISVNKTRTTNTLIDNFSEPTGSILNLYHTLHLSQYIECGGISLKICRVADGTADVFFKEVVVHNWDTAAPQLVLEEAGGILTNGQGIPITYRGEYWITGLVAANTPATFNAWFKWHEHYYSGGV